MSHAFFHQNAKALQKSYGLSLSRARQIITACPDCPQLTPSLSYGVNPRGLTALELWQADVTHIPDFVRLQFVHISVDTFCETIAATAHTGEKARDICKHFLLAFATLGLPKTIKTDNGPGRISRKVLEFLQSWRVKHLTGIPHSPTGQAIVERTRSTLKAMLLKQKGGMEKAPAAERLAKSTYVLNFLNRWRDDGEPMIASVSEERANACGKVLC